MKGQALKDAQKKHYADLKLAASSKIAQVVMERLPEEEGDEYSVSSSTEAEDEGAELLCYMNKAEVGGSESDGEASEKHPPSLGLNLVLGTQPDYFGHQSDSSEEGEESEDLSHLVPRINKGKEDRDAAAAVVVFQPGSPEKESGVLERTESGILGGNKGKGRVKQMARAVELSETESMTPESPPFSPSSPESAEFYIEPPVEGANGWDTWGPYHDTLTTLVDRANAKVMDESDLALRQQIIEDQ